MTSKHNLENSSKDYSENSSKDYSTDSNQLLEPEDLKQLLRKGLERKTKSKNAAKDVLEWFDFEFHTIYEAGKWKGLEDFYFKLRGKK